MAREWMREAREKTGKTMATVAKELNISESYYCTIENGQRMRRLDIQFAMALADALRIPIKRILDEEAK